MNDDRRKVWETYVASWKAESSDDKRALFEEALAPTCVYTDPLTQAEGWDALLGYMAGFHQQIPGAYFETTYFLSHHDKSIARWNMMNGEGVAIGEGISYAEFDRDNRLVAMTGFFDAPGG